MYMEQDRKEDNGNGEPSWQLLVVTLFLFLMLMTPVVMWCLGL